MQQKIRSEAEESARYQQEIEDEVRAEFESQTNDNNGSKTLIDGDDNEQIITPVNNLQLEFQLKQPDVMFGK